MMAGGGPRSVTPGPHFMRRGSEWRAALGSYSTVLLDNEPCALRCCGTAARMGRLCGARVLLGDEGGSNPANGELTVGGGGGGGGGTGGGGDDGLGLDQGGVTDCSALKLLSKGFADR